MGIENKATDQLKSLLLFCKIIPSILGTDYTTVESNDEIGKYRETVGTFTEGRTFLQIPLIMKFAFGQKIKPGIYGGFYIHGSGLSSGSWDYLEHIYARKYNGTWVVHDIPHTTNVRQSKGFSTKTNIGWLVGAECQFYLNRRFDLLWGGRFQEGFRFDSQYPPLRRNTWLIELGLLFKNKSKNR